MTSMRSLHFSRAKLISSCILGGVITALLYSILLQSNEVIITYTGTSYEPYTTTIAPGTAVRFVNASSFSHWPASDLHPHHSLYPEFDSLRGIGPGEDWVFTFDKEGSWSFHNHIQSRAGGVVHVTSDSSSIITCDIESTEENCWAELLATAVQESGPQSGMDMLRTLHTTHENFATQCHRFAHDVGLKSYIGYGTDFDWSIDMGFCNSGFYHGYLEGLINERSSLSEIDSFCSELGVSLQSVFPAAENQCRHGIGHGYGEYLLYNRTDLWNDPAELYALATEGCERSNDNHEHKMMCMYGAVTVLLDIFTHENSLTDEEILGLCTGLNKPFAKEGCYWGAPKFLPDNHNRDLAATLQALVDHYPTEDAFYFENSIHSIVSVLARPLLHSDDSELITVCKTIFTNQTEQDRCLEAAVEGLYFTAAPKTEFLRGFTFCDSTLLTERESLRCYQKISTINADSYTELIDTACNALPQEVLPNIPECGINAT